MPHKQSIVNKRQARGARLVLVGKGEGSLKVFAQREGVLAWCMVPLYAEQGWLSNAGKSEGKFEDK